jgi:glucosamine--fructose-6-phosphate aminotransferase (isomerizing)
MCGIIGAIAKRDVVPILMEGLKRLEYRGYDSAGLAVLDYASHQLQNQRVTGKVQQLENKLKNTTCSSTMGIAHTRWATHGKPSDKNAHPHISKNTVAVVHNGIVENYLSLRHQLEQQGYQFVSDTDTEVIAHQIHFFLQQNNDLNSAVLDTLPLLKGAYAIAVISSAAPDYLIAARLGSPLVIGVGIGENFVASDAAALIPVTQRIIYLEEGDVVTLQRDNFYITDITGNLVTRHEQISRLAIDAMERGEHRHYMHKEIFEQPHAIAETLEGRIYQESILAAILGPQATDLLEPITAVQIIACGTSYHAGLVARYWIETFVRIPCFVEIASEFRYRQPLANPRTLIVTLSQSGETADTLAALQEAKRLGFGPSLAICNVPESALVRASDLVLMTHAGPEIGVASTKAFTTQLVCLLILTVLLGRHRGMSVEVESKIVRALLSLPRQLEAVLKLDTQITQLAEQFADKQHTLFR